MYRQLSFSDVVRYLSTHLSAYAYTNLLDHASLESARALPSRQRAYLFTGSSFLSSCLSGSLYICLSTCILACERAFLYIRLCAPAAMRYVMFIYLSISRYMSLYMYLHMLVCIYTFHVSACVGLYVGSACRSAEVMSGDRRAAFGAAESRASSNAPPPAHASSSLVSEPHRERARRRRRSLKEDR